MSKSSVDANYRFIAAYQEVNTRIAQRQQALALYVTLIVSLLAALVTLRPAAGSTEPSVEWLILGFPIASICLAFLNYKTELSITNIRAFLSTLERLDDAHKTLPSYNTDPQWSRSANKARSFHDYAVVVLAVGANAAGLGVAQAIYPQRFAEKPLFLYGAIALALLSLIVLCITPKRKYTPHEEKNAQGDALG